MKNIWTFVGRGSYFVLYPVLLMFLHGSTRTRIVVRNKNKVLLVRPWLHDGSWELPGGGVHKGEMVVNGALRELYEETGLTIVRSKLKKLHSYTNKRGFASFEVIAFCTNFDEKPEITLQRIELIDYEWVPRSKLKNYRLAQGVKEAVERCFAP